MEEDTRNGEAVDVRAPVAWEGAPWHPRKWQAEALPIIIDGLKARKRGVVCAVMGAGKSILQSELCYLAMHKAGDRAIIVTAPKQKLVRQLAATLAARCGEDNVGTFYADKKQHDRRIVVACNASAAKLATVLEETGRSVALMICDEAHGTEGEKLKTSIDAIKPVSLVGFTATPFRSAESERLELFDEVFYRYTIVDATRDGVLVPMKHRGWDQHSTPPIDEACLSMVARFGVGPGIVSASSIADAEDFAEQLRDAGIQAEAIHSRQKVAEREDKLERLRVGELDALVHCSLLSEGVDLPWLRWICLRRCVEARVRFLQELGRVLRIDPEPRDDLGPKREGVVMDPHMLLAKHGLTSTEAIGKAMDEEAEQEEEQGTRKEREAAAARERRAVAWVMLTDHLRAMWEAMDAADLITHGRFTIRNPDAPISTKQATAIGRLSFATGAIPPVYRPAIRQVIELKKGLTVQQASDLLDILGASADYRRKFTPAGSPAYYTRVPPHLFGGLAPLSEDDFRPVLRGKAGTALLEELPK
jgi:superfamily II DNA or RNA helicase